MIDLNKKYKTRCGFEVRLYAIYPEQSWAIHGAYKRDDNVWINCSWLENGLWLADPDNKLTLIEVKPERWYPIFFDPDAERLETAAWMGSIGYPTKNDAMLLAKSALGRQPVDAWKAPE